MLPASPAILGPSLLQEGKVAELFTESLYPLDSVSSRSLCQRQLCLPLSYLLCGSGQAQGLSIHFQFSSSEPEFYSLSQHFWPTIWVQHLS